MRYPRIEKYIAVDITNLRNKVIEEWVEVKAFYQLYEKEKVGKLRNIIINKYIEELHDLCQVLNTLAYAAMITIYKPTKVELSIRNLMNCTKNKIEFIKEDINMNQLKEIINHSFDFISNIIRIVCIDNDISFEKTFKDHVKKMKSRGVIE